jgi:protein translocase SecG subunit
MDTVVFVLQILMWILCPAVIGLILLQGAAGDISSAFGGGGQLDASLGVGAHRKMAQATGVLAVLFFAMVLALAYPSRKSFRDVNGAAKPAVTQPAPAQAVTPPAVEAAKPAPAAPKAEAAPEAPKAEVAAPAQPAAESPKAEAVQPTVPALVPAGKP